MNYNLILFVCADTNIGYNLSVEPSCHKLQSLGAKILTLVYRINVQWKLNKPCMTQFDGLVFTPAYYRYYVALTKEANTLRLNKTVIRSKVKMITLCKMHLVILWCWPIVGNTRSLIEHYTGIGHNLFVQPASSSLILELDTTCLYCTTSF